MVEPILREPSSQQSRHRLPLHPGVIWELLPIQGKLYPNLSLKSNSIHLFKFKIAVRNLHFGLEKVYNTQNPGQTNMRNFSPIDKLLTEAQHFLDTLNHTPVAQRPNPAQDFLNPELTADEQRISQGCMRVNHTGEICAQALYRGQAFGTANTKLKAHFGKAANEESDHLNWCQERLNELHTHTSYLNPFWYLASFMIGIAAARLGDNLSLGFVEETEHQVIKHLSNHQKALPKQDQKSHAIIKKMTEDEAKHAEHAHHAGAKELPATLKLLMHCQSKVMTTTAYYI